MFLADHLSRAAQQEIVKPGDSFFKSVFSGSTEYQSYASLSRDPSWWRLTQTTKLFVREFLKPFEKPSTPSKHVEVSKNQPSDSSPQTTVPELKAKSASPSLPVVKRTRTRVIKPLSRFSNYATQFLVVKNNNNSNNNNKKTVELS